MIEGVKIMAGANQLTFAHTSLQTKTPPTKQLKLAQLSTASSLLP